MASSLRRSLDPNQGPARRVDRGWNRGTKHGGRSLVLARQRHAYILERVNVDGAVRVADLVRDLGVSDMTVRRDLEYLGQRGAVERVHGGATAISGTALFQPGFTTKSALPHREKEAIPGAGAGPARPPNAIPASP